MVDRAPDLNEWGQEIWVTRDYGGEGKALSLHKSVLGVFVHELIRLGGGITSTHNMRADYPGSYVQFVIYLPKGRREVLQTASGITLEHMPRLMPA